MVSSFYDAVRRRRLGLVATLAVALVAFSATVASATVMIYVDLARLVELSDVIVRGKVVDQTTYIDPKDEHIKTRTTFEVAKAYYGDVNDGQRIQFVQYGGEYGDEAMMIPGDAEFFPHEESIIFLDDGEGEWVGSRFLTALGQSKYTVYRKSEQTTVHRSFAGTVLVDQETRKVTHRSDEHRSLESFEAELQTLVAGIKGGAR